MPNSSSKLISVDSVLTLGPNRHEIPDERVITEVHRRVGFDVSSIFDGIDRRLIAQKLAAFPDFTFIRSIEELDLISGYYPTNSMAPFGVSYNFGKKNKKRKLVDWYIDIYGICFDGQFADNERVAVWRDHAFVFDWSNFCEFLNHWGKDNK